MSQTDATSTNNGFRKKKTERKWPCMTRNLGYLGSAHFELRSTHILRLVRGIPARKSIFARVPDFSDCLLINSVKWPNHAQCRISQWPGQFHYLPADLSNERASWYLYEHIYGKSATRMRATSHARSRWRRQWNQKTLLVRLTMMTKCKEKGEVNM